MKKVLLENSFSPCVNEGKLFYFTINAQPVRARRYFLTENREISKFVTTGIELYSYNAVTPNFPQTITYNGQLYNTINILDAQKFHFTWYDKESNALEYHKPLVSYNKFPSGLGNTFLLEMRQYNFEIFTPKSYYTYVTNAAMITPFPVIIPFFFYW